MRLLDSPAYHSLIIRMIEESIFDVGNPGICEACGYEAYGVEPDAEGYTCENCGEPKVIGAELALIRYL